MPKLGCKCGFQIDLSPIPCEDEFYLIRSESMEAVFEAIETNPKSAGRLLDESIRQAVICPNCNRLFLSRGDGRNDYDVFVPSVVEQDNETAGQATLPKE